MKNSKTVNLLASAMLYLGLLILAALPNAAAATLTQQLIVVLLISMGASIYLSRLIGWNL